MMKVSSTPLPCFEGAKIPDRPNSVYGRVARLTWLLFLSLSPTSACTVQRSLYFRNKTYLLTPSETCLEIGPIMEIDLLPSECEPANLVWTCEGIRPIRQNIRFCPSEKKSKEELARDIITGKTPVNGEIHESFALGFAKAVFAEDFLPSQTKKLSEIEARMFQSAVFNEQAFRLLDRFKQALVTKVQAIYKQVETAILSHLNAKNSLSISAMFKCLEPLKIL